MKINTLIITTLLLFTAIVNGQDANRIETFSKLKSTDTSERITAIREAMEGKIVNALPILEAEIEKQELFLQPLYIEALRELKSNKMQEIITQYVEKINKIANQQGVKLSEEESKTLVHSLMGIFKEQNLESNEKAVQ